MTRMISLAIISLTFCCFNSITAFAAAGCCSHHGGVVGCNKANNHQLCKDGTSSPTCLCTGGKTTKEIKAKTTVRGTSTTTTTAPTATTPGAKTSTKGCCARHGGIAKCDTATGYFVCKDGTHSATCKCS